MTNISVIGGSNCSEEVYESAREVGRLLASNKITVICGGLTGVMEAVARGVSEKGGICVGILPGLDASVANRYISAAIPTGIGYARDFLVVRAGESVIAIDGESGTATEAYFAISESKPLICLYRNDIKSSKAGDGVVVLARTPKEAVDAAIKLARDGKK